MAIMLRRVILTMAGILFFNVPGHAAVDGWTLGMAWSPDYCNSNLSSKEPQCTEERYFTVDALIPKFPGTAPKCSDDDLSKEEAERWLVEIPNRSQIKRVWRHQGSCSELSAADYFTDVERASRRLVIPAQFEGVTEAISTTRSAFKAAFVEANPGMTPEAMKLECHGRGLSRVEFCLNAQFQFRACDVADTCDEDPLKLKAVAASRVGRKPVYR